ncbi:MAG: aspartate carbamoyltransferase regulatory subunit [Eubacteriales bacterium]|nr:aspartate carbamoyltransferase regulatory subunit [Eubacteriales bacterium]MDD4390547.1 aspartate carbamoyltransferase regulatory subunit [Eubacteriales bacterium]
MIIGQIKNGIVLDHITAGKGMDLYQILGLDKLECQVAIIKNADSAKLGKKDIIKINEVIDINFDAIGYVDPRVTVNIINDGKLIKRTRIQMPEIIEDIIICKNPRCITTTEQDIKHVFKLTDREKGIYRCIYCESKAE